MLANRVQVLRSTGSSGIHTRGKKTLDCLGLVDIDVANLAALASHTILMVDHAHGYCLECCVLSGHELPRLMALFYAAVCLITCC